DGGELQRTTTKRKPGVGDVIQATATAAKTAAARQRRQRQRHQIRQRRDANPSDSDDDEDSSSEAAKTAAYSDKSRDYTVADTGILAAPQGSSEPIVSTGLQANPHVAGTFVSNMGMQQAFPDRQMPAWDPNKGNYGSSVAGTFPGQPFGPSAGALYPASAARPTAPAGYVQASQQMPHYGTQPRPAARGAPFIGHPPRYF
ncbi:hypothetical protein BHM03_00032686, partial [Ensete ventricosum]